MDLGRHVGVVGGGPAALAAAALLSRRGGLRVTLVRGRRPSGPAIGLWPHGLRTLEELGALSALERRGKYMRESGYRSVAGTWLARPSPLGALHDAGAPASILFAAQEDVLQVLEAQLDERVEQRETALTRLEDAGAGVRAYLADGSALECDLLVGADGRDSLCREFVAPGQAPLRYRGYRVFRGTCAGRLTHESFQTWGPGLRFASVPLSEGQVWFAALHGPAGGADLDDLLRALRGWHEPVEALVRATDLADLYVEDAMAMADFPSAAHGRVCLIGDAARTLDPVLALGAGLALEDALLLSQLPALAGPAAALPAALQSFSAGRSRKAQQLQLLSDVAQTLGAAGPIAASLRNLGLLLCPDGLSRRAFDAVLGRVASPPS